MLETEIRPVPEVAGYRIERRLGEGGMAEVWAATQLALEREVALKVVSTDGRITPDMAARFEREARTIARLDHPNIVRIHDVGRTADGRLYYSMPLLANGDLGRRDLRFAPREVARVLRGVLEGLAHAHAQGVIHRDVKPANILFDRNDLPLLADFGIALSETERVRVTSQRQTLGSSSYMSPEQARSGDVDIRADLYSLGVVAFELLTGDLPFHGADPLAVALAHIEQPVPRLPPAHAAWQPFIDRALGKAPANRFATAPEMLAGLDAVERAMDSAALANPSKVEAQVEAPSALPARRWPWLALAAVVIAILLVANPKRNSAPTDTTVRQTVPALDAAAFATLLGEGDALLVRGHAVDPDGDNAAERFLAALPVDDPQQRARAGLERALAAASAQAQKALQAGDGAAAAQLWQRSYAVAERSAIADWPAWAAFERTIGESAHQAFDRASARLDRSMLEKLAPLLDVIASNDTALAGKRARVAQLPAPGTALRDPGGPLLVLVPARAGKQRAFAIATTEVRRGDYAAFVRATGRKDASCPDSSSPLALLARRDWRLPGFEQDDTHPVVCVSAADAAAYAAWLSQRSGARYRLPSRAEWLQAVRGTRVEACRSGNLLDNAARPLRSHFDCDDGFAHTAPGGRFARNPQGLRDASGNVAEWSSDCAKPASAGGCTAQVTLGSSFRQGPSAAGADYSDDYNSNAGRPDLGFRLLREIALDNLPPAAAR